MGKKSVKENKNIYQLYREEAELTREAASEQMEVVSAARIEKIESEKTVPYPEEILAMAKCYKAPDLCNYFCSNECPIGMKYVPEIKKKDLPNIVLEILAALNTLDKNKERLIEISSNGQINDDEEEDFDFIKSQLDKLSASVDSLQLWLEKEVMEKEE